MTCMASSLNTPLRLTSAPSGRRGSSRSRDTGRSPLVSIGRSASAADRLQAQFKVTRPAAAAVNSQENSGQQWREQRTRPGHVRGECRAQGTSAKSTTQQHFFKVIRKIEKRVIQTGTERRRREAGVQQSIENGLGSCMYGGPQLLWYTLRSDLFLSTGRVFQNC